MSRLALKDATLALHHATGGPSFCDWNIASIVDRRNSKFPFRENLASTPWTVDAAARFQSSSGEGGITIAETPRNLVSLEFAENAGDRA